MGSADVSRVLTGWIVGTSEKLPKLAVPLPQSALSTVGTGLNKGQYIRPCRSRAPYSLKCGPSRMLLSLTSSVIKAEGDITATEQVNAVPGASHRDIEQSSLLGVRERFGLRHYQLKQRIIAYLRWERVAARVQPQHDHIIRLEPLR